jgi:hypothetical protein
VAGCPSENTRVIDDEIVEARLKDWDIATVQGRDLFGVLINADNVVAEISKTSTRDKPDIAAANHCDVHRYPLSLRTRPIIIINEMKVRDIETGETGGLEQSAARHRDCEISCLLSTTPPIKQG